MTIHRWSTSSRYLMDSVLIMPQLPTLIIFCPHWWIPTSTENSTIWTVIGCLWSPLPEMIIMRFVELAPLLSNYAKQKWLLGRVFQLFELAISSDSYLPRSWNHPTLIHHLHLPNSERFMYPCSMWSLLLHLWCLWIQANFPVQRRGLYWRPCQSSGLWSLTVCKASTHLMVQLASEQLSSYMSAMTCHIHEGPLGSERVRDHNHYTGVYKGPTHVRYNLSWSRLNFLPVIVHEQFWHPFHCFYPSCKISHRKSRSNNPKPRVICWGNH